MSKLTDLTKQTHTFGDTKLKNLIRTLIFLVALTNDALGNANTGTLDDLNKKLWALEKSYSTRISHLEEKLATKVNDVLKLEDTVRRLEETLEAMVTRIEPPGSRIHTIKKRQKDVIPAFSVYLAHNSLLDAGQIIMFDQVTTNEANGYSVQTGIFTCPMAGLYLFSFQVMVSGEAEHAEMGAWVDLMVNAQNTEDGAVDAFHLHQEL
ncbi:uncharacterized protein LOC127835055 [Dreissena polymorpha]|uniref:uncharacterized protein LOC127835055 n=1 Tax=Dreissena polymorpha TaxID=45954 RepID=UPI002264D289|nr:uncharacterized protein LOC127835055 [Dreissena polymorpha]